MQDAAEAGGGEIMKQARAGVHRWRRFPGRTGFSLSLAKLWQLWKLSLG